jgi:hypothetical protein
MINSGVELMMKSSSHLLGKPGGGNATPVLYDKVDDEAVNDNKKCNKRMHKNEKGHTVHTTASTWQDKNLELLVEL